MSAHFNDRFRCPLCNLRHAFLHCEKFRALSVFERKQKIYRLNGCFNCLALSHTVYQCPSYNRCVRCMGKHHSLLHSPKTEREGIPKVSPSQVVCESDLVVIKMTIVALLEWENRSTSARLSLNFSRGTSAIYGPFARQHDIPIINIRGTSCCMVTVRSTKMNRAINVQCEIFDGDNTNSPKRPVDREFIMRAYPLVEAADPLFWRPQPIQLVLGAETVRDIIYGAPRSAEFGPAAFPTIFGWCFVGKTRAQTS